MTITRYLTLIPYIKAPQFLRSLHRFVDACTLNSRPDERAGRPRDEPPSQSSSADVFLMKPLKIHERLRPARLATIQLSSNYSPEKHFIILMNIFTAVFTLVSVSVILRSLEFCSLIDLRWEIKLLQDPRKFVNVT